MFLLFCIGFIIGLIIGLYAGNYQKEQNELKEFKKKYHITNFREGEK